MFVEILDIGSGNICSIKNWIERVNVPTRVVTKATDIQSDFLILPGVGSAGSYMERIKKGGFDQAILEHVDKGNRLLGICLGFQLMAESSEEDGGVEGLNLLPANVVKLHNATSHNDWESFKFDKNELGTHSLNSRYNLSRKRKINGRVFFNHEYGFALHNEQKESVYTKPVSTELEQYSSIVVKNNIIGIQFHPEKSQKTGIDLISMIL